MRKKILSVVLLILVVTSMLAGCGGGEYKQDKGKVTTEGFFSWFPFDEVLQDEITAKHEPWYDSETRLDVNYIISTTEITDELLNGYFTYNNGEKAITSRIEVDEEFCNSSKWQTYENLFGERKPEFRDWEFATIPYTFISGKNNCTDVASYIEGYSWCELKFVRRMTGTTKFDADELREFKVPAAYEIDGDKIRFYLLLDYDYDKGRGRIDYELDDSYLEYTFDRKPFTFSLSDGKNTVNMLSHQLGCGPSFYEGAHFNAENFTLDEMEVVNLSFGASLNKNNTTYCSMEIKGDKSTGETMPYVACKLRADGLFTLCVKTNDDQVKKYEYVLYCNEKSGFTLVNEKERIVCRDREYAYAREYSKVKSRNLRAEDVEKYEKLTEEKKEQIETTRKNLLEDLTKEFSDEGVSVKVDKESGEIVLDSAILFATDKSEVSSDGKVVLEKFISSFNTVLQKDEYKDFIDEIRVTGHTDSTGEYDHNVELSKARAESVKDYCLESMEEDAVAKSKFESLLTSEGKASDELVMGEDGNEDKAASRRVVFTFYINLDAIE